MQKDYDDFHVIKTYQDYLEITVRNLENTINTGCHTEHARKILDKQLQRAKEAVAANQNLKMEYAPKDVNQGLTNYINSAAASAVPTLSKEQIEEFSKQFKEGQDKAIRKTQENYRRSQSMMNTFIG